MMKFGLAVIAAAALFMAVGCDPDNSGATQQMPPGSKSGEQPGAGSKAPQGIPDSARQAIEQNAPK